jgi:hypothetical protein
MTSVWVFKKLEVGECNCYCEHYQGGGACCAQGMPCPKTLTQKLYTEKQLEEAKAKGKIGKTVFLNRAEAEIAVFGKRIYS